MSDDDLATTYDLDAWAPPAPNAGLADAVIARVRQPPAVVAIEPEDSPARRRWWLAGGIAGALAVAVIAVVVVGTMRRAPSAGSGTVIADKARSVSLDDSHVQLDPGAELSWERDGDRVRAVLRAGAATFSIDGDDTFVIEGAALASVEATGARLRMEARMNATDPRVIGASAVTAAAVAILTIMVYEGHVKASHGGQTQTVAVGGTLEVRAVPPAPPPTPVAVGAGPDVQAQLEEKDREIERLRNALEDAQRLATGDPTNRTAPKRSPPPPAPSPPDACDADPLTTRGDEMAANGLWAAALASWEAAMRCKPSTSLTKKAAMAACNSKNAAKAKLYVSRLDDSVATGVVQICIRNGIEVRTAPCDADALRQKGNDALGIGKDSLALEHFEKALGCGGGEDVRRLAVLAACRAVDAESALRHAMRLPDAARKPLVPVCARTGVDISIVRLHGELRVSTKPASRVFINGKEFGTTPMTMQIVPGKHKITFQVGDEKYTYPVVIEEGKTVTMVKSLE